MISLAKSTVSRAYYAFLNIARAALLTKKIRVKTHAGTIRMFSKFFVKTGPVPPEFIEEFKHLKELREQADYEGVMGFKKIDAQEALTAAEAFVKAVEKVIKQKG